MKDMYQESGSGYGIKMLSSNVFRSSEETWRPRPVWQQDDMFDEDALQHKGSGGLDLRTQAYTCKICDVAF